MVNYFVHIYRRLTGAWRKLHDDELHDLYSSPTTVQVIKSRRVRWVGHAAHMQRGEVYTGLWWENMMERDHWEDSGIDGRMILRWIFNKQDVRVWNGLSWLRTETGGGHL
jgi:hypothetical protein